MHCRLHALQTNAAVFPLLRRGPHIVVKQREQHRLFFPHLRFSIHGAHRELLEEPANQHRCPFPLPLLFVVAVEQLRQKERPFVGLLLSRCLLFLLNCVCNSERLAPVYTLNIQNVKLCALLKNFNPFRARLNVTLLTKASGSTSTCRN